MWPIEKAIVSTVRPNANETPSRPIPTSGKAAAKTALPHPPRTSQNVPKVSAAYLFMSPPPWMVTREPLGLPLPEHRRGFDPAGENHLPNVRDGRQVRGGRSAPLEAHRRRRP